MRLICFWCMVVTFARAQDYYAPQTFKQGNQLFEPSNLPWNSALRKANEAGPYYRGMFSTGDADTAGSVSQSWRPGNEAPVYEDYRDKSNYAAPQETKPEPWRQPYGMSKEQQASILHHKQSLSADGAFRFEYASDNGLAAGEMIEPDGSRVGAYQYKDPSGQLVKLKYRAGKEGFQILEGSHVPKSPQPVPPQNTDEYYQQSYDQQRRQYDVPQQYNQQRPEPTQYRDNDIDPSRPHSFGEGYAFAFKGKGNY
ncbi:uncharacterized protein LOC123702316 isoform X4 [Colias croceus]|uniref:uncharacterized protein LOC123702316 isoform X4 n=1 Tax=Colias crocea TaxID=72248 RepID=UPI001E27E06D|nr:uncharacterized protein LOC123702316 isoform X4 [Colias croceus]